MHNTKSATTAGLLGIFLGGVGAHNWYLGEKTKGIIHCCLFGVGIILIIVTMIMPSANPIGFLQMLGLWTAVSTIAYAIIGASSVWGLVEGIIILTQGDAGLAAKGYAVATPAPMAPQGYGPMPQPGYGQPMPVQPMAPQGYGPMPQPGYGQPMSQPMPDQPTPVQPMPEQPTDKPAPTPEPVSQDNNVNGGENGQ